MFGIFAVNGWHNVLHLATGLLGLAAAGYCRAHLRAGGRAPLPGRRDLGLPHRQRRRDPEHRPGEHRGQRPAPDPRRASGSPPAQQVLRGRRRARGPRPPEDRYRRGAVPLGRSRADADALGGRPESGRPPAAAHAHDHERAAGDRARGARRPPAAPSCAGRGARRARPPRARPPSSRARPRPAR